MEATRGGKEERKERMEGYQGRWEGPQPDSGPPKQAGTSAGFPILLSSLSLSLLDLQFPHLFPPQYSSSSPSPSPLWQCCDCQGALRDKWSRITSCTHWMTVVCSYGSTYVSSGKCLKCVCRRSRRAASIFIFHFFDIDLTSFHHKCVIRDIVAAPLYKSKHRGSPDILWLIAFVCLCVRSSSWGIKGVYGPHWPTESPSSPGHTAGFSLVERVCLVRVCAFRGASLTRDVLRPRGTSDINEAST